MKRSPTMLKLVSTDVSFVAVPRPLGATPRLRGFAMRYRDGMHCPGCDARNWYIGRSSAECARCGTALPLASAGQAQ